MIGEELPGDDGSGPLSEPEGDRLSRSRRFRVGGRSLAAVVAVAGLVAAVAVTSDVGRQSEVRVLSDQGDSAGRRAIAGLSQGPTDGVAQGEAPSTSSSPGPPVVKGAESTTTTRGTGTTTTTKAGGGDSSSSTTSTSTTVTSTTTSTTAPILQPPSILGRIVFSSDRALYGKTPDFDIWVMDPDGKNPKNLSNLWGSDSEPDLSPDGRRIVWNHSLGNGSVLMTMDSDGTNQRQLVPVGGGYISPRWAPDGQRILYNGTGGLRTIRPDGADDRLAFLKLRAWHADWAPDGHRIVVEPEVGDPSNDGIWVVDLADQSMTRVFPRRGHHPAWSPSGDRIVFSGKPDHAGGETDLSDRNVYSVRPDGSDLVRLTAFAQDGMNDLWALDATWSPDGSRIVFTLGQSKERVWEMNADGSNLHQLVDASARDRQATF